MHNWDNSKADEIVLELHSHTGMVARVLFMNNQTGESIVLAIVVGHGPEPCVLMTTADGPPLRDRNAALSQHAASETSETSASRAKPLEEEDPVASPASENLLRCYTGVL
jgi:hypothetical protein